MRDRPGCATDREVGIVAAVLAAGSEKEAAHRLGLSHSTVNHHLANARSRVSAATTAQLVWILGPRLPGPRATPKRTRMPSGLGLESAFMLRKLRSMDDGSRPSPSREARSGSSSGCSRT
jgi:DNA-binding CsgD family transcriptional regulator